MSYGFSVLVALVRKTTSDEKPHDITARTGIIVASVGGCALPYSAYLAFLVAFTTIVIERRIYKGNAERVKIDLIWAVRTGPKSTIK